MVEVIQAMEKYSRGRRGAPAKGVGRATGARVQIPLSPLALKKEPKGSFFNANGEKELSRRFRRGLTGLKRTSTCENAFGFAKRSLLYKDFVKASKLCKQSNDFLERSQYEIRSIELRVPRAGGTKYLQIPY